MMKGLIICTGGNDRMKLLFAAFMLSLICISTAVADVEINEVNFPDANFRDKVIRQRDTDNNGILSDEEIEEIESLYLYEYYCDSLKGIELLTALKSLKCNDSRLTSLDVSGCTALENLECSNNSLTSLDVSHNKALQLLWCDGNRLTSLDVSHNMALTNLHCQDNKLTALDVSHNLALEELLCHNNKLTHLNVTKNAVLLERISQCDTRIELRLEYVSFFYMEIRVFAVDTSLFVVPMEMMPNRPRPTPEFILPASTKSIESEAFAGIKNMVFQTPNTVGFIAADAFDPSVIVIVEPGSYAETRCKELGLTVYVNK